MLLIVFIVVWLALPLVLIPLVFYYRSKYRKLESENSQLKAASGSPTQETISPKPVQSGNPYTPPPLRVIPVRDKPYSVTSIDSPQIPVNASLTYASKQSDAQAELFTPAAQPTPEAQAELFAQTAQATPEARAELFAPTAQATPASASEYRTIAPPASANPAPRVEKDSGGGVAMIFGVIFVALAGLAFASTTWADMNNIVRMIVIFVFAVVFFVTSSVAERRLRLERTGIAFYSLGSCFLPITLFAAGYFKVFGQWFSLFGGGKYLLIAAAFALMSAVFAKGSSDYKSTFFSWSALASASASVASLLRLICGEWTLAFVFVSIYSLMLVLLSGKISKITNDRLLTLASSFGLFSALNALALSLVAVFVLDNSPLTFLALCIFASCFLFRPFSDRDEYFSAVPFILIAFMAFYRLVTPDYDNALTLMLSGAAVLTLVLSAVNFLGEKLRLALYRMAIVPTFVAILSGMMDASVTLPMLVGSFVLCASAFISVLTRKSGINKAVLAVSLVQVSLLSAKTLFASGLLTALGFSGFVLSVMIIYIVFGNERLRNLSSDIIFVTTLLLAQFYALLQNDAFAGKLSVLVPIIALIAALGALLCSSPKRKAFVWISLIMSISAVESLRNAIEYFASEPAAMWTIFISRQVWIAAGFAVACVLAVKKSDSYLKLPLTILPFIYAYLSATASAGKLPVYVTMLIVCVFLIARLFDKTCKYVHPCAAGIILSTVLATWSAIEYHSFVGTGAAENLLVACIQCVFFYIMAEIFLLIDKESRIGRLLRPVSSAALCVAVFVSFLWYYISGEGYFIPLAIIMTVAVIPCVRLRSTLWFALPLLVFFPAASVFAGEYATFVELSVLVSSVIICLAFGRLMHPNKLIDGKYCDVYSLAGISGILTLVGESDKSTWLAFVLFALWLAQFGGRVKETRTVLSVAAFFAVVAWWSQPYIVLPSIISLELTLLPLLLYCGVLAIIWRDKLKSVAALTFVVSAFDILTLGAAAIASGLFTDSVIVAALSIVVLLLSFFIHRGRWLVLGITSLVLMTISMAQTFWSVFGWWTYLMLAGVILIGFGIRNELKKKRAETAEATQLAAWKW